MSHHISWFMFLVCIVTCVHPTRVHKCKSGCVSVYFTIQHYVDHRNAALYHKPRMNRHKGKSRGDVAGDALYYYTFQCIIL